MSLPSDLSKGHPVNYDPSRGKILRSVLGLIVLAGVTAYLLVSRLFF